MGRIDAVHNVLAGRLGHLPRWRGMLGRFRPQEPAALRRDRVDARGRERRRPGASALMTGGGTLLAVALVPAMATWLPQILCRR